MNKGKRVWRRNGWPKTPVFLMALSMVTLFRCAHNPPRVYGYPGTSPRPETPWEPPKQAVDKQTAFQTTGTKKGGAIPPAFLADSMDLSLIEIVNIALINNKQTRQTWAQARAAAAAYGSAKGSDFPDINVSLAATMVKNPALGGQLSSGAREYSANSSLNWLLFDCGGRRAGIDGARETLFAADWTHNAVIQNVVLQTEQAFYAYFAAKALLSAQKATVDEAQTVLDATNDRHLAGLATIADVLQAQTALSQATLTFETVQGQLMTTRGVLATAMGLPANTTFEVELPVGAPPLTASKKTVQEYLDLALRERPDLAAAWAQAMASDALVTAVRAQGLPSVEASGVVGELYLNDFSKGNNTYNAALSINIPVFSGFSNHYNVLAARARADAARADAENMHDLVTLQVWTSYYNLETDGQVVRTSDDLLKSASENHDVALDRYKAGVGNILDLLTAQAALQNARAQQVRARADWWLAVAQLAHDTGTLRAALPPKKGPGQ